MNLDKHYKAEFDGNQWILYFEKESEKDNPKTGKKMVSKNQWYHKDLKGVLASYIDKKLSISESIDDAILMLRNELKELKESLIIK